MFWSSTFSGIHLIWHCQLLGPLGIITMHLIVGSNAFDVAFDNGDSLHLDTTPSHWFAVSSPTGLLCVLIKCTIFLSFYTDAATSLFC